MHALVYLAGFWYEYYNSAKQQDTAIGYKIGRGTRASKRLTV